MDQRSGSSILSPPAARQSMLARAAGFFARPFPWLILVLAAVFVALAARDR